MENEPDRKPLELRSNVIASMDELVRGIRVLKTQLAKIENDPDAIDRQRGNIKTRVANFRKSIEKQKRNLSVASDESLSPQELEQYKDQILNLETTLNQLESDYPQVFN